MGALNVCTFIGNLGRDAEMRHTANGDAVATLNLACSESWKDKQGAKQERTEWVRIVLWGKTAESLAPYLTKGKQIYVSGRMETRKWTDKNGVERYTTEIRGDKVVLLGSRGDGSRSESTARHVRDEEVGHGEPAIAATSEYDDEIPF